MAKAGEILKEQMVLFDSFETSYPLSQPQYYF